VACRCRSAPRRRPGSTAADHVSAAAGARLRGTITPGLTGGPGVPGRGCSPCLQAPLPPAASGGKGHDHSAGWCHRPGGLRPFDQPGHPEGVRPGGRSRPHGRRKYPARARAPSPRPAEAACRTAGEGRGTPPAPSPLLPARGRAARLADSRCGVLPQGRGGARGGSR